MHVDGDTKLTSKPANQAATDLHSASEHDDSPMKIPGRLVAGLVLTAGLLSGCWDSKPEHYYVMCDGKDWNGWNLIDTESQDGYLIACTYQSPDKKRSYTARCRSNGCD